MAKVRFIEDHLYETVTPVYRRGQAYTVSEADAAKLIGLGVAVPFEPEHEPAKPRRKAAKVAWNEPADNSDDKVEP